MVKIGQPYRMKGLLCRIAFILEILKSESHISRPDEITQIVNDILLFRDGGYEEVAGFLETLR